MATWQDVESIASALPETVEGTAYGNRAWRYRKKLLFWERPLTAREQRELGDAAPAGEILALRTADVFEKEECIAVAPEVFFTTAHFDQHAVVLARLERLPADVLREMARAARIRAREAAPQR